MKRDSNMLISVIIPVYKAEKYLDKCVQSVIDQTYPRFELLLIDDGSPDQCGQICDQWAEKDSRVKVLHRKNAGVSAARNAGIRAATGDYITFCDADDELLPDCLRILVAYPEKDDLVIVGHQTIDDHGNIKRIRKYEKAHYSSMNRELALELLGTKKLASVWDKRFKRTVLIDHSVFFDEQVDFSEDTLLNAQYLRYVDTVSVDEHICYCYRSHDDITLSHFDFRLLFDRAFPNEIKILAVLEQSFGGIRQSIPWKKRIWGFYYDSIFGVLKSNAITWREKNKELKRIIRSEYYRELVPDIEVLAVSDGERIRRLLQLAQSEPLLFYWCCAQCKSRLSLLMKRRK